MQVSSRARLVCLVALGFWMLETRLVAATTVAPTLAAALRQSSLESPTKVIHLRKVARKVLSLGHQSEDEQPIRLGPARARLLWQKNWKWPEFSREQKMPGGLLGGPVLSIDLPLKRIARALSVETRFCSSRYAYPSQKTQRIVLEELADPQTERQSVEGGLYLNFSFGAF
jgi:hypothetical protein